MGLPARAAVAMLAVAASAAAAGCASQASGDPARPAPVAKVRERDFNIAAPRGLSAGRVRFAVHNAGPDTHELLVIRGRAGHLPMRTDGLTVDEHALGPAVVGSVAGQTPGATHGLTVNLSPGRYVLLCNMTGHYLGGMRRDLVVR